MLTGRLHVISHARFFTRTPNPSTYIYTNQPTRHSNTNELRISNEKLKTMTEYEHKEKSMNQKVHIFLLQLILTFQIKEHLYVFGSKKGKASCINKV